jgi:hypothetical protein
MPATGAVGIKEQHDQILARRQPRREAAVWLARLDALSKDLLEFVISTESKPS